ncbi:electron transfer flavoprotein subunit alpha [Proteiniborus sp. MB09-C3]|uniref:electron transfer flavoprotein subunit alpha n=1 Tax=Proteiniborus sp. MB09-C3 TaxID=3050072 RepID=UPI002553CCAE|nr:electron transfer flavoprotein subunit alpha [Proteiniborus sp. MB09-C3]WIV11984.1 electron transfer flavoprotein subunit alpha [Proteiniborus sp. MB09-C3]
MAVKIIGEKCTGCSTCVDACPFEAIELNEGKAYIKDNCTSCGTCIEACPFEAIVKEEEIKAEADDISKYKGVWVFAEQREGKLLNVVVELLGEGRKIADKLGVPLTAVLLGNNINDIAEKLVKYGADVVLYAESKLLEIYTTDGYAKVISELVKDRKPEIILIGATNIGRDLGPRLSAKVHTGLTADCTRLEIDEEDNKLLMTRPAFGGNLMATIICPDHRPQMSTVRPGVMERAKYDESRKGKIELIDAKLSQEDIKASVESVVKSGKAEVPLEEAKIIVAGGRGLGTHEGFELVEKLAKKLGGVVGASRATVDEGWIEHSHQVGQTGKTVRPKLYVACGISGAIQHLAGMQDAECIIAINKNPDAPIFKIADYGIVGDVTEIIPAILEVLDNVDDIVTAVKAVGNNV